MQRLDDNFQNKESMTETIKKGFFQGTDYLSEHFNTSSLQDISASFSHSESCEWLNQVLKVFISEWKESKSFKKYWILKMKKAYNKKRPEYLGEIKVTNFSINES